MSLASGSGLLLEVREIELLERRVTFRLPFRFGIVTLTEAPQAFVRVRIERGNNFSAWGVAAELLAPKWFDKNPSLSNEQNFEQLRQSLRIARETYLESPPASAFALFADHYPRLIEACSGQGLNSLIGGYGPALLDRAILDALCRSVGLPMHSVVQKNLVGLEATRMARDLAAFDMQRFLAHLQPRPSIFARHTIGLLDRITQASPGQRVDDGLPETLEEVVARYGQRYFKIKIAGDSDADIDRLRQIATLLDNIGHPYFVTIDGNEQYQDIEQVVGFWQTVTRIRALERLTKATLFLEQPLDRGIALDSDISALSRLIPVIIDESDAHPDSFLRARQLGYRGVSSKACKGIYRALLNAARCQAFNQSAPGRYFLCAEDLSTQAGVALQQDLATACLLGIRHIERNGHYYVDGFGAAPESEAHDFLSAHPDLYELDGQTARPRLRIDDGAIATGSLQLPGFAHDAEPDWSSMTAL